jgi:hypothetical protein
MSTMLEWLQQQLEEEIAAAVAVGQTDVECRMMNALVIVFACIGEYHRALPLCEECLAKGKRVFGEDHPRTLTSLFCIAGLFESKGEYDRALPLHEECLAKRKRVLGDDHPDTLTSLKNVALVLKQTGAMTLLLSQNVKTYFFRAAAAIWQTRVPRFAHVHLPTVELSQLLRAAA